VANVRGSNDMCYWLYILKHELQAQGCTLALSVSPHEHDVGGGRLQTANYRSWEQLSDVLLRAGIAPEILRSTKAAIESEGWDTLRDVVLSQEQLRVLGFAG